MLLRELIISYRKQHKMSQRQFAKKCGNLSNGYISMLENDLNPATNKSISPSLEKLACLASGMDMSFDELISKADDLKVDLSSVASETVFVEETDKEITDSFSNTLVDWAPIGGEIDAINAMSYNYGIQIRRLDGASNYVLSGKDGAYEVSEQEMQAVFNSIRAGVVEKLMYLEKDKQIEALKGME